MDYLIEEAIMPSANTVIKEISRFVSDIPKKALAGGTVSLLKLKGELESRVPVDTGAYRSSWSYNKNSFNSGKVLASMSVFSPIKYGYFLETGSFPGKKPWPHVGKKTAFGSDGKIYSIQALRGGGNGVIRTLVTNNKVNFMVSLISDRIMDGLR